MSLYRTDCRHFTGEKPCLPHKQEGVVCRDCPRHEPVTERLLIVKLDAAGDVLRTTSLLPALRRQRPGAAIWWVTDPSSRPLLEGNPLVDVLLGLDASLPGILAATDFQTAYNFDMGRRASGVLSLARSSVKKGFGLSPEGAVVPLGPGSEEWFEMGVNDGAKRANRRTYQDHLFRMAGLDYAGEEPQLPLTEAEQEQAREFAQRHRLKRFKRIVGLNIGSGGRWPMKRWRPEGFVGLTRSLRRRMPGTGVLLYGGPEERELMPTMARKLKGAALSTGADNSLRRFAALVGLCDLLVTGDTLALHVAVALGKKVVAYFGPTSETEIDLYGRGEKVLPDHPCQCYYRNQCTAQVPCMDDLKEGKLLAAIQRQFGSVS